MKKKLSKFQDSEGRFNVPGSAENLSDQDLLERSRCVIERNRALMERSRCVIENAKRQLAEFGAKTRFAIVEGNPSASSTGCQMADLHIIDPDGTVHPVSQ